MVLVHIDENDSFQICEPTIEHLKRTTPQDGLIELVVFAGWAQTGKSFLANLCYKHFCNKNGTQRPFKVDKRTGSIVTKGIWITAEPIVIRSKIGKCPRYVYFCDVEALDGEVRGPHFDQRLVALLNLFSTTIIFNVKHVLYENQIDTILSFAKNTYGAEREERGPHIVVALRHVQLILENDLGEKISDDQYLKDTLLGSNNDAFINRNGERPRICRNIATECITMPSPTLSSDDINAEFIQSFERLISIITNENTTTLCDNVCANVDHFSERLKKSVELCNDFTHVKLLACDKIDQKELVDLRERQWHAFELDFFNSHFLPFARQFIEAATTTEQVHKMRAELEQFWALSSRRFYDRFIKYPIDHIQQLINEQLLEVASLPPVAKRVKKRRTQVEKLVASHFTK